MTVIRRGDGCCQRLAVLLAGGVLAGCSLGAEVRDHMRELRRGWEAFRDASAPVAGISTSTHAALGVSVSNAIDVAEQATE